MKISYTIIILAIITIQTYSQIDTTDKGEQFNKFKEYLNEKDVQKDVPNNIYQEYLNKKFGIPPENQQPQIIPIPPARKKNRFFKLLPLYKQGDIVVRFLQK